MATAGLALFAATACLAGLSVMVVVAADGEASRPRLDARPTSDGWDTRTWAGAVEPPPERKVEVLVLGDGYVEGETRRRFVADFARCARSLLEAEPIVRFRDRFRIRGLVEPSRDQRCDATWEEDVVDTALDCRFDTRRGRLLMVRDQRKLFALARSALPVDVVLVMVNTPRRGGAATTLRERSGWQLPVGVFSTSGEGLTDTVVHEFGHCFAGLADEYADAKIREEREMPTCCSENLDAANVSLWRVVDDASFASIAATVKWGHFLGLPGAQEHEWLHRGGYYHETGVLRPWPNCRMRASCEDAFCPVCDEEVAKRIVATLGETWDDAEWHRQRPLSDWK